MQGKHALAFCATSKVWGMHFRGEEGLDDNSKHLVGLK